MDCIVPGNSVRTITAALCCLSRVGKEVSIEFDPIDGLTMRALSDSKAAFVSFHYSPSFFEKCSYRHSTQHGNGSAKRARTKLRGPQQCQPVSQLESEDHGRPHWSGCLAVRALGGVVNQRKGVTSLQLISTDDAVFFRFYLRIQHETSFHVSFKIPVSGSKSSTVLTSTRRASEITVHPAVALKMIEPLQKTAEMALLVNDTRRYVSSLTFGGTHDRRRTVAEVEAAALKTQVTIAYDELIEVHYQPQHDSNTNANSQPADINQRAILVFGMKEFKAMVTFCVQALEHEELPITLQFHWGGKPVLLSTSSRGFEATMTVATLDHTLIRGMASTCSS